MDIRAAEISAILKDQIKNFGKEAEVSEVGEPDLVEVLVADHAVVYEEELDASLDGD